MLSVKCDPLRLLNDSDETILTGFSITFWILGDSILNPVHNGSKVFIKPNGVDKLKVELFIQLKKLPSTKFGAEFEFCNFDQKF